jgi:putative oxidoreductase
MNAAANPYVPLLARIYLAALFLVSGIQKAMAFAGTAAYFGKIGLPAPEAMAAIAVVVEIGGALLIILGFKTRLAAWGLAIWVVIAMFVGHRFWQFSDPAQFNAQMIQFLKNLAILGGFMMLAVAGPGRLSIDKG